MGLLDTGLSLASSVGGIPGVDLIPGAGFVKQGLGLLTSFLKGGVPDHERPDLIAIAEHTGLTQQQASDLCGMEEKRSPDNYDTIVKKYANNPSGLLPLIAEWNVKYPDKQIGSSAPAPTVVPVSVVQVPATLTAGTVPAQVQQPSLASNLSGQDVKALGGAVLAGAQTGATNWALSTPQGQAAKAEGFKSWLTDNQLYVFAGVLAVLGLIYKAFFAKK